MLRGVTMLFAATLVGGAHACHRTGQAPPAAPTATAAEPLRFAWPAGAHAVVRERVLEKGRWATTRYRIVTEHDGATILVWYRDFAFVEIEGVDLNDERARAEITAIERQLAGAIPPYRVAADGTWLGCGDLDAFVERLGGVMTPAEVAATRRLLADPRARAIVDAKLRDVWQAWVEGWLGFALAPGERREGSSELAIGETILTLPYVVERLEGEPDVIVVRATSTTEGPAAATMVGAAIDGLASAWRERSGDADVALASIPLHRVHMREATLDRATMLPMRAMSRTVITVGEGEGAIESVESHEWTFEWSS